MQAENGESRDGEFGGVSVRPHDGGAQDQSLDRPVETTRFKRVQPKTARDLVDL